MKSKSLVRFMVIVVVFLFTFASIWLTGNKVQAQFLPPFPMFLPPVYRTGIETLCINPYSPATLQADPIITSTRIVTDTVKTAAITPLIPLFIYSEDNEDHMIEKSDDKQAMIVAAIGLIPFF
ncbi:MAG: hypothetical protein ACMUIL_09395 [bacterium]